MSGSNRAIYVVTQRCLPGTKQPSSLRGTNDTSISDSGPKSLPRAMIGRLNTTVMVSRPLMRVLEGRALGSKTTWLTDGDTDTTRSGRLIGSTSWPSVCATIVFGRCPHQAMPRGRQMCESTTTTLATLVAMNGMRERAAYQQGKAKRVPSSAMWHVANDLLPLQHYVSRVSIQSTRQLNNNNNNTDNVCDNETINYEPVEERWW
jgi:hypothetical protein